MHGELGAPGTDQKPTFPNTLRAQHSTCSQDAVTYNTWVLSPRHDKGPRGALSGGLFPTRGSHPLQKGGGPCGVATRSCENIHVVSRPHSYPRFPSLSRAESLGHHQAGCDPGSESWQEGPGRHGLGESRLSESGSLVQMAPRA